jgi:uncharacterized protein YukE
MDAMDFSVNARAVAGLADALDLRAHDLTRTSTYLQVNSRLTFGAGLINELAQTHEQAMSAIQTFLRHAANDNAEAYSRGISDALRAYATTDLAASARLDVTLPGVIDPSVPAHLADQSVGPEIFADPACLTFPDPPDFEAQHPYQPEWADALSPSSIPRDLVWYVTSALASIGLLPGPCDPFQTFVRPICGDWAGLARTSFALTEVAKALGFVSGRVNQEATGLDRVWTGNAASSCHSVLKQFAHDLLPACDVIGALADDYRQISDEAREKGEALAAVVSLLIDICGSLGVEVAAEISVEALADMPKLIRTSEEIYDALLTGVRLIEELTEVVHSQKIDINALALQLGILPTRPLDFTLPDAVPALPR